MIKTLQVINLSNNQLSGPLPTELGSLADLRKFFFANSKTVSFDFTILTLFLIMLRLSIPRKHRNYQVQPQSSLRIHSIGSF